MGVSMCEHNYKPSKTKDNFPKKSGINTHRIAKLLGNVFLSISQTRVINSECLLKLEVSLLDKRKIHGTRAPEHIFRKKRCS